ncbi:MAG TPA: acyl carrier protein [Rhodopila sp.]
MAQPTDDVKNWMNMFRWIVKLIRDEYEVDETTLTRSAVLEADCGLAIEQVEVVLDTISESFQIRFPTGTLDEVVKLEELCMLAAWMKGLYKRPEFISAGFEELCRLENTTCG